MSCEKDNNTSHTEEITDIEVAEEENASLAKNEAIEESEPDVLDEALPKAEENGEEEDVLKDVPDEADGSFADEENMEEFIFDGDTQPTFELIESEIPVYDEEDAKTEEENDTEKSEEEASSVPAVTEKVKKSKKERKVGSRRIDTLFDFLELFIFTLVGVLIVTSFLFRHSIVSGDSMQSTLENGDRLIISDLFYEPKYGDIVVVEDRKAGITSPIVKRVIATEGQTVRIERTGISVDGVFLLEEYVFTDGFTYYYDLEPFAFSDNETLVLMPGEYFEFVVPEGELFVLGDHRNNSRDSRYYGTVREDAVLGRLILRFYPFDKFEFYLFKD